MRVSIFYLLTILLLALIGMHMLIWVGHMQIHGGGGCGCLIEQNETVLVIMSIILSVFLSSIGIVAYRRDGRSPLLIITSAYLILLLHCSLWLVGLGYPVDSAMHFISHDAGIILLIVGIALIIAATCRRRK